MKIFSEDVEREYLFRCDDCHMVLIVKVEKEEEAKVHENKLILHCPCEGKCRVLRD